MLTDAFQFTDSMKAPSHFLKVCFLFLVLFCSLASTCDQEVRKFNETAKFTLAPENIVNINGKLEFSVSMEYNTGYVKNADSLEVRFYLKNSQIETLLGSATDNVLREIPFQRTIRKDFKTTWFSKVPITKIEMQTLLFKKGKQKVLPAVVVGEIVSRPGD